MSGTVTITVPAVASVGITFSVSGTVSPAADPVQLQLDTQSITLPLGPWTSATAASGLFSGVLQIVASGTWYVWAYDPVSGASAASSAIFAGAPNLIAFSGVPVTTSVAASLLGGTLAGDTPDELSTAAAATDSDTALVSQSGKVLFGQPFSAIWTWIQGHLPGYLLPQVTVATTGTVNLDNSAHNQRVILVTATGVTIQPLIPSMGPGFCCDVINASGSTIALSGVTTNTGATTISAGGHARFLAVTLSGALTIYADLGGS